MQPQTHPKVIYLVVGSIALLAFLCVSTLCYCLVSGKVPNQTLLTAVVGLATGAFSALSALLVNTRSAPTDPATQVTTEQKTTSTTVTKPVVPASELITSNQPVVIPEHSVSIAEQIVTKPEPAKDDPLPPVVSSNPEPSSPAI